MPQESILVIVDKFPVLVLEENYCEVILSAKKKCTCQP